MKEPREGSSPGALDEPTWEELRKNAEGWWLLVWPHSHGGTTLYRYRGRLFTVGYGDYSSLPGGAEQILDSRPDNTPGFPPAMDDGHAAGCRHEPHRDTDRWLNGTRELRIERRSVEVSESAELLWRCSVESFVRTDSPQRDDVLHRFGPAVLDEALRCARARL
jgi:hypothetical protein